MILANIDRIAGITTKGAYITRAPFTQLLTLEEDTAITNFIERLGTIYTVDIEEMFFLGMRERVNALIGWKGLAVCNNNSAVEHDSRKGMNTTSTVLQTTFRPQSMSTGSSLAYCYTGWSNDTWDSDTASPPNPFRDDLFYLIDANGNKQAHFGHTTTDQIRYACNDTGASSGNGIFAGFQPKKQYSTINTSSGARITAMIDGVDVANNGVTVKGGFSDSVIMFGGNGWHLGGAFMKNATEAKVLELYRAFYILYEEMGIVAG